MRIPGRTLFIYGNSTTGSIQNEITGDIFTDALNKKSAILEVIPLIS